MSLSMFTSLMKNGEVPLLLKKEKGGNGGGEGGREETQLRLRNVCFSHFSRWMGAKVWEWLIEIKRKTEQQQLYVSKFRWLLQLWQESIKVMIVWRAKKAEKE